MLIPRKDLTIMAQVISVNALQFIVDKAIDALHSVDLCKTKIVWFGHTVYIDVIQKALIVTVGRKCPSTAGVKCP